MAEFGILSRTWRRLAAELSAPFRRSGTFATDPETGFVTRKYASYQEYVRHQAEKLPKNLEALRVHDAAYEQIVFERYNRLPVSGKSVLCLGARLGGEVRAFRRLGALAIGIDLEPGPKNAFVLHGDVHELQFADGVFDFTFTNIIDHILYLHRFIDEIIRVLKLDGSLIAEISESKPGAYEVNDLSEPMRVRNLLEARFRVESELPIHNPTDYTNWRGRMLVLEKAMG